MPRIRCTVSQATLNVVNHPRRIELNVDDGDPVYLDAMAITTLIDMLQTAAAVLQSREIGTS